ncbi:hypothetical protein KAU32_08795 [bacterium]|nr:hypothetical protein [bacterium]
MNSVEMVDRLKYSEQRIVGKTQEANIRWIPAFAGMTIKDVWRMFSCETDRIVQKFKCSRLKAGEKEIKMDLSLHSS